MYNLHPVLLIYPSMAVKLQPIVSEDTMGCLQNMVDLMSFTVTGLILSLDMKDILIRLKVLSVIVVVKKKNFVFILCSPRSNFLFLFFPNFLFLGLIMFMLPEMEMLLSLAVLTLALLVGTPLTPGRRWLALYCVYSHILEAIHCLVNI